MFEKLGLTRMAQGLAAHSAARLGMIAANVANADTPGYRRKTVAFQAAPLPGEPVGAASGVRTGPVQLDRRALPQIYDPGHILADETGHYAGSTVELMVEIADAREAQRSYEANLRLFEQTRQMSQSLMSLLRR